MTLNAKKNKPRVNYNSTGEKMSEQKSDENSYYSNTRKNIFNVYPRESLFFFFASLTRNSKFLAASGDFILAMSLRMLVAYGRAFMIGML